MDLPTRIDLVCIVDCDSANVLEVKERENMAQVILDLGSGNSCQNDWKIAKKMIDEIKKVDTGRHSIVLKWQLFEKAGDNIPLDREIFKKAYDYAEKKGYRTTSSVFDKESLDFLMQFDVPFIKLANNRDLDWLIGEIPRKVPLVISYGSVEELKAAPPMTGNFQRLLCVSDYPADLEKYEQAFDLAYYVSCGYGISDHTADFELWNKYQPPVIEWHFVLEHDENNLDGGLFARIPAQLSEVL